MVSKIWFGNHVRGHVRRHARGHVHSHARGISVLLPLCFRFASVMLVKLIVKTRAASRGAPLQLILVPFFFEMLHIYYTFCTWPPIETDHTRDYAVASA